MKRRHRSQQVSPSQKSTGGKSPRLTLLEIKPYAALALTLVPSILSLIVILSPHFSQADRDKAWAALFAVVGFWFGTASS